jgi:hypothetical protein
MERRRRSSMERRRRRSEGPTGNDPWFDGWEELGSSEGGPSPGGGGENGQADIPANRHTGLDEDLLWVDDEDLLNLPAYNAESRKQREAEARQSRSAKRQANDADTEPRASKKSKKSPKPKRDPPRKGAQPFPQSSTSSEDSGSDKRPAAGKGGVKKSGKKGVNSPEQRRAEPEIIDLGSPSEEEFEARETVDHSLEGGNGQQLGPAGSIVPEEPAAEGSKDSPSSRPLKKARKSQDEQPGPSKAKAGAEASTGQAAAEESEEESPPPAKKKPEKKAKKAPEKRTYNLRKRKKKK